MAERIRRPHPFRAETPRPNVVRSLTVLATHQLAPRYIRLTLGGEELGAFEGHPAMTGDGFDDVAVLFFADDTGTIARPIAHDNGALLPDVEGRILAREYTVRELTPTALTIDVVLHDTGIASDFARTAAPGQELVVVGPRVSRALPTSDRFVAIGDATALPALQRLAQLAPNATLVACVPADLQDLVPEPARWVEGDADAAATQLALDGVDLTPDTTVWIAGESSFATSLRRYFVTLRGVAKDRIQFTGYWRRGSAGLLEHPADD